MAKRLIFGVVLLLVVVSAQVLAAGCDLRCSLMPLGHHHDAAMQMADCHGMSMQDDHKVTVSSADACPVSLCSAALQAVAGSSSQQHVVSDMLTAATAAPSLLALPLATPAPERSLPPDLGPRSFSRAPLAERPGSSLRI